MTFWILDKTMVSLSPPLIILLLGNTTLPDFLHMTVSESGPKIGPHVSLGRQLGES